MPALSKATVLSTCVVSQARRQLDQSFRRCSSEARHPPTLNPSPPFHVLSEKITYTPSTPPSPPTPTPRLSPEAKAGIITACIFIFLLLFLLTLELAYLGRQRRARAAQQAQCEAAEQGGTEARAEGAEAENGGVELKESKENVVLESRVEIVVEGEDNEVQEVNTARASWGGGSDADGEEDEEDERVW